MGVRGSKEALEGEICLGSTYGCKGQPSSKGCEGRTKQLRVLVLGVY